MYKRDYLLNEARRFAQLLAKLMGLKVEGQEVEYLQEFSHVLQTEYDAELETLLNLTLEEFKRTLQESTYSPEKMNALAQMLYVFAQPLDPTPEVRSILQKVLIIFDLLEEKHHFQTFENIDKRNTIYRFFKTNYERSDLENT